MGWIYVLIYLIGVGVSGKLHEYVDGWDGNPMAIIFWPAVIPAAVLIAAIVLPVWFGTWAIGKIVAYIQQIHASEK